MKTLPKEIVTPKAQYSFVSLGCPKNTVDSERMLGLLQLDGYQLVPNPKDADFVVVNTCGFIEDARAESYNAIDEMIARSAVRAPEAARGASGGGGGTSEGNS